MSDSFLYSSAFISSIVGLSLVFHLFKKVKNEPIDDEKAKSIADKIKDGAMTFLKEEYKIIGFVVIPVVLLLLIKGGLVSALCFLFGSVLSLIAGFIGMYSATDANVRTTIAAKNKGEMSAFMIALAGGGVMGFAVASFGIVGIASLMFLFAKKSNLIFNLSAFGFGASFVAFFARVGGGIYTKSADVGADLVGKLEAGIPEDDPRNPAVIADNVGDCVGDTAGMGADIFESFVGSMIASIVLAINNYGWDNKYVFLPLVLSILGLIGSIVGFFINFIIKSNPSKMLRISTYLSTFVFAILAFAYMKLMGIGGTFVSGDLFYSIIIGCLSGIVVGIITEYYTGSFPVHKLAKNSETGAATNLIYGLSLGMESTVAPVIILALGIWASYIFSGGAFGVSIAAISMLATVAITMTIDAFGPIADNAGGISEMSQFDPSVRKITDKLDALGNTTAAMGKGFAIGSALLASLGMFSAYAEEAKILSLDLNNVNVLVGMFIGGVIPFLISALTMRSVGEAALKMVVEVRRQFREIPGLMEGKAEADYKKCIAISTRAALTKMLLPGIITTCTPIIIYLSPLGKHGVGGLLVGSTLVSVLLALMMANGGGAWDNAKKYIESGHFGGKGSDAHRAAVIGDTVGDPFKDTSGPALNILMKLMPIISLLLVTLK